MPSCCKLPVCRKKRRRRSKSCRRRSRSRTKKCYRSGRVTRNAFFNFLRAYRRKHCGKSITQIAISGARQWNRMSESQRCKYIRQACTAPKYRRRRRRRC